jgi:hypothetical protein
LHKETEKLYQIIKAQKTNRIQKRVEEKNSSAKEIEKAEIIKKIKLYQRKLSILRGG